jgi:predicted permease
VTLESIVQDVRFACRSARKRPGFTASAVLTLALGLGLNAAFFTVLNAYVLRPAAVRDPDSLYQVSVVAKGRARTGMTWPEYDALRSRTDVFGEVLAERDLFVSLSGRLSRGLLVSGNYFSMLGGGTLFGRPIHGTDQEPVIVLSHDVWRSRFASDRAIVGKVVALGRQPFVVTGVAAPEFSGLHGADFWIPMSVWPLVTGADREPSNLGIVGRLRPDTTKESAAAALHSSVTGWTIDGPVKSPADRVELRSAATMFELPQDAMLALLPLLVAFALTMAIPCTNVANMMLAQGLARHREIGVRLSLGASRWRIVQQLVTEGLLLALLAGCVGLGVARVVLELAIRVVSATAPPAAHVMLSVLMPEFAVDYRVFTFMLAAAVATTLFFALVPALQATSLPASFALRGEFRRLRGSRLRDTLLVAELGTCLVLLVTTGVLLRGLGRLAAIDPGYDARGVYSLANYTPIDAARLASALGAEPWVERVAHASDLSRVSIASADSGQFEPALYSVVSPEYLPLFGIPIVRGRNFGEQETMPGAAVVVVSRATANRFWPGEDAIGKTLRLDPAGAAPGQRHALAGLSQVEVVGVARDVSSGSVADGPDRLRLYFPLRAGATTSVFVRAKGQGLNTVRLFQEAWMRIARPDQAAVVFSMDQRRYWDTYPFRALSWVSSLLGLIALLLTLSGIYGVMSYLVNQRMKEIGIRMALGATRAGVARLLAGYSARVLVVGALWGALLTAGVLKLLAVRIEAIDPFEPVAYCAGLSIVAATTFAATLGPALRATRLNPADTLRAQ